LFSAIIATEVSILTNFLLNNFWTWEKNKNQFSFIKRLFSYNLVALGGLLISVITLFVLTDVFNMYYLISNLFGILLATFWNYIINDKITFKIKN
jgi:dolichol-phosphate mannosyltransferase